MSTEPSPREVDISFSTAMIQAERDGRKTVTRRILKSQPPPWANDPQMAVGQWLHFHGHHPPEPCGHPACSCTASDAPAMWTTKLRYKIGDILRVREAAWMWCEKVPDGLTKKKRSKFRYVPQQEHAPVYVADGGNKPLPIRTALTMPPGAKEFVWRLKIPRFLPRWAVRTRLRVISVRVERLQAITEEDAKREGVNVGERGHIVGSTPDQIGRLPCSHCGKKRIAHVGSTHACWGGMGTTWNPTTYRGGFSYLWESINGPGSWDANPWVARIEFERA